MAARRVNQDPEADQMQKIRKRKRREDADANHRPKSLCVDLVTKKPSAFEIFRIEQMREKKLRIRDYRVVLRELWDALPAWKRDSYNEQSLALK